VRRALLLLALTPSLLAAQDAESLRTRIAAHYAAIHGQQNEAVIGHHLPDMTIFPQTGHVLMEAGWQEADTRMGAEMPFPEANVAMRDFNAQIYGDVGVATFVVQQKRETLGRITVAGREQRWGEGLPIPAPT